MPVVRASVGLQFNRHVRFVTLTTYALGIQHKNPPLLLGRDGGIFNKQWVRVATTEVPVQCHHARNRDHVANIGGLFARHNQIVVTGIACPVLHVDEIAPQDAIVYLHYLPTGRDRLAGEGRLVHVQRRDGF